MRRVRLGLLIVCEITTIQASRMLPKSLFLALMLASPLAAAVTITSTTPLPPGVATVPYSFVLAASGGTAPYTWSLVGALPVGLGLASNGAISGTANTATVSGFRSEERRVGK